MQPLREVNVQKCLEVLEDFHGTVPVDDGNQELMEKKVHARHALDRLSNIFDEKPGGKVQCDQDNPR